MKNQLISYSRDLLSLTERLPEQFHNLIEQHGGEIPKAAVYQDKDVPFVDLPYPVNTLPVYNRRRKRLELYAAPWPRTGEPDRVVVCAANRCGDLIIPGARHFDMVMHGIIEKLDPKHRPKPGEQEQGFIDQWGVFMNRYEALVVAETSGRHLDYERNGGNGRELYSEGLY